jgi:hypothetical protein
MILATKIDEVRMRGKEGFVGIVTVGGIARYFEVLSDLPITGETIRGMFKNAGNMVAQDFEQGKFK